VTKLRRECPLCAGHDLVEGPSRRGVPVFQNALYATAALARAAPVGDLAIRGCRRCGFVFNAAFDPGLVAYGADYENDQTVSPAFAAHVDRIADRVLAAARHREAPIVLEVGCGQGGFLERLAHRAGGRLGGAIGFDPAYRGVTAAHGAAVRIEAKLFDRAAAESIGRDIDVVATRHVIEHVPDPIGFLMAIAVALPEGETVALVVETPCVDWIFENEVLQDFFYEHCNYFTVETLGFALKRAGFADVSIEHVFDGQYLLATARSGGGDDPGHPVDASASAQRCADFARTSSTQGNVWRKRIAETGCPVALWGAGAKGVTFAGAIDPERALISCLIDVNPRKQNCFAAATAHPILSPEQAADAGVRTVIIMNPNYRGEIAATVQRQGWPFELWEG
jgi:SAM-dependent methyltransferase